LTVIEVLTAGALSTVQDMGRTSYRRFGVGTAGAMDSLALSVGNVLVNNPSDAAGVEVPVLPFRVRFEEALDFAVSGADCLMTLDDKPLLPWWKYRAEAGQVLSLGHDGKSFSVGARSYLTVAGGVDVPLVLGSRSTQLRGRFGGHQGRALVDGDVLQTGATPRTLKAADKELPTCGLIEFGVVPPDIALDASDFFPTANMGVTAVRVIPAAEYDDFDAEALKQFWAADWKITAQSDRYGYRLSGPALQLKSVLETRSHGVVPGVIQVPPSGQPIIQMRDAQPSGGYPKIGTVIDADIWRLAQAPAGSKIRFVAASYSQALAALQSNSAYLDKVRSLVSLYRSMYV
jgi:biotin-dependent carboxylase-like uncharacterized protein